MIAKRKSSSVRPKTNHREGVEKKKPTIKSHAASHPSATATIDRREKSDRRGNNERRIQNAAVASDRRTTERRVKVNRRRQIDPTTCERDYTPDEVEFMAAMDAYKRHSGRMFPTCSEVLEVVKSLGYAKQPQTEAAGMLPSLDTSAPAGELATVG